MPLIYIIITQNKIDFTTVYGISSRIVFVRFLGEFKTLKRHFEINWSLASLVSLAEWLENSGKFKSGFLVSKLVGRGEQGKKIGI